MDQNSFGVSLPSKDSLPLFKVHFHEDGVNRTIVSAIRLLPGNALTTDILRDKRRVQTVSRPADIVP